MKKLWEFLVSGCWHDWRDYAEAPVSLTAPGGNRVVNSGMVFVRKCEKCRTVNSKRILANDGFIGRVFGV